MDVAQWYSNSESIDVTTIACPDAASHTMGASLSRYVERKIPAATVAATIAAGNRVIVAGIATAHLPEVTDMLFGGPLTAVEFASPTRPKRHNTIRPTFWRDPRSADEPSMSVNRKVSVPEGGAFGDATALKAGADIASLELTGAVPGPPRQEGSRSEW